MAGEPLAVALVFRDHHPEVDRLQADLVQFLTARPDVRLVHVGQIDELTEWHLPPQVVVVIGGDGSILRTCRFMNREQLPMLGINLGRLGFLADLWPEEFQEKFPQLVDGRYRVAHHLMIQCTLFREGEPPQQHLGLNEAAILAGGALRLLDIDLHVDGEQVTTYSCDGLIVSTPVGSTAHNLAAGGPILRQDLRVIVVTPICPHTLTDRPIVDSADRVYELIVPDVPPGATLAVDGQVKIPLRTGDRVRIEKADVTCQMIRLSNHSYYRTLHRKLGWAGSTTPETPPR